MELLQSPDFFSKLLKALSREGLVGEEGNALVVFIVCVSRLLSKPLNLFVKGHSSSGKNHTVKKVLRLIPPKYIYEISNSSERAWNYMGEQLKHKIVFFQEESVAFGGKQHPARLLISENRLERTITVRKKGGGFETKKQITEGPVACISTTTKDQLQVDDETRHLSVWADESPAQTARIVRAQLLDARQLSDEEIRVWHEVQEILEERSRVAILLPPWFGLIADKVWTGDVRIRRYFPAFIEACRTICLIRSFLKEEKSPDSLRIGFKDYAIATLIVQDAFSKSLNAADEENLQVRECITRLSSQKNRGAVSASDLARDLGIPLHEGYKRIREAVKHKLVRRVNFPQRANRKLFLPAEEGNFLPEPQRLFKLVAPAGKQLSLLHPLTGKKVVYQA
jgi:hypothetical protein